ncbi:MAG: hypothetical protein QXY62_01190 [Candidatus Altiarchaeota archaeon]
MISKKQIFIIGLIIMAFVVGLMIGSSQPSGKGYHSPSEIYPQGSGSGLDADMVDGKHVGAFETATPTLGQTCTTACSNIGKSCAFGISISTTKTTASNVLQDTTVPDCDGSDLNCLTVLSDVSVSVDIKKCSETGAKECACWP